MRTAIELSISEGKEAARKYPMGRAHFCNVQAVGPRFERINQTYTCTRLPNHDGEHAAHINDNEVAAVWS